MRILVCLDELALITNRRDSKTNVLVRVRESPSNTRVRASDDDWWREDGAWYLP